MPTRDEGKLCVRIPVVAEGVVWLAVLANVQLGLRHPDNTGPSSKIALEFVQQLLPKLRDEGILSNDELATIVRDDIKHFARRGREKAR